MAVLLTNGKFYIAHSKNGSVIKVPDMEMAQDFHTVERAVAQKEKAPGKCAGCFYIDTCITGKVPEVGKKPAGVNRKRFSKEDRISIYRKTDGHCYLCGELVAFNSFEIEHHIPVSKGGTNELCNLFCSCHNCNSIKRNVYPQDFMEKISQIFMYQMEKKYSGSPLWEDAKALMAGLV